MKVLNHKMDFLVFCEIHSNSFKKGKKCFKNGIQKQQGINAPFP